MSAENENDQESRAYLLHLTDAQLEALRNACEEEKYNAVNDGRTLKDGAADAFRAIEHARPRSDEDLIELGRGALRRDYFTDCERIARDALEAGLWHCKHEDEGTVDWDDVREAADEHVHESVDGSSWVIDTASAMDVLRISDNDGAVEDYGTDGIVTDGCINWSLLACCAMMADVRDYLGPMIDAAEEAAEEAELQADEAARQEAEAEEAAEAARQEADEDAEDEPDAPKGGAS